MVVALAAPHAHRRELVLTVGVARLGADRVSSLATQIFRLDFVGGPAVKLKRCAKAKSATGDSMKINATKRTNNESWLWHARLPMC